MNSATGLARERVSASMPCLLRWAEPDRHIAVELLTASLQEITAPSAQPFILDGLISDEEDSRTWTVLFIEPYAPDCMNGSGDALSSGIVGFAGREAACADILSQLERESHRLTMPLLLITVAGETASILLWDPEAGTKTTLTQFPSDFDHLRIAQFQPFEIKQLGSSDQQPPLPDVPASAAINENTTPSSPPIPSTASPARVKVQLEVPRYIWAAGCLLAAAVIVSIYGTELLHLIQRDPPVQTGTLSPIGIQVSQHEKNLDILWDRSAVRDGKSGALKVVDGEDRFAMPLSAADLAAGRIAYTPRAANIVVEVVVHTSTGQLSDRVRILMVPSPATVSPEPVRKNPVSTPPAERLLETASEPEAQDFARSRFFPPNRAPEPHPVLATALPALELQSTNMSQAVISQPLTVPQPPQPPPDIAEQTNGRETTTSPAMPVTFQPAIPTRRVNPIVPVVLRRTLFQPTTIEVIVNIDTAGRVLSAQTPEYSGSLAHLAKLAQDAAQRWKFQPALRNDQSIASSYRIRFTFSRDE